MKKAVIFDLDGTMWDSTGCACDIWNQLISRFDNINFTMTQKMTEKLMGKTMDEIGDYLFPEMNLKMRNQILDAFGDEEVKYLYEHGAILYEGLVDSLTELRKEYDLYIVSNCQDGYVNAFLHAHGLEEYFKDIEMSGRTGLGKGSNIQLIMERNNIQSAVYVGDTEGDENASRCNNLPFVWAKYGFGIAKHPDAEISSICELKEVLCKLEW